MKFTDLDVQKNPLPFFTQLRKDAPVFRDPETGVYLITRDADLRAVAMDTKNFSNVIDPAVFRSVQGLSLEQSDPEVAAILKARGWLLPFTLLLTDPPEHSRYRRLAQEALGPKAINHIREQIRGRVDTILADFPANGEVDFVEAFSKRLPVWVVCRFIFGAPEKDFARINHWADQFFNTLMPSAPREEYLRTVDAIIELHHFIKANLDRLRQEPDDDVLLSRLIHMETTEGDAPLSEPELISMMHVSLLAGHDTTRQSLSNSLFELARQPGMFERLKNDRASIGNFIDEVLRLNSPANVTPRIALHDTQVASTVIPAGAMVFMAWGSGNRDEEVYKDADSFDLDRPNVRKHLAFGTGIHLCVGAHLARAQVTIALESILDRYSGVDLVIAESAIEYAPSMNTRNIVALPVKFRAS